jgi:hypothetical protein
VYNLGINSQGGLIFQTYDCEYFGSTYGMFRDNKRMLGDYRLYYTTQDLSQPPAGATVISYNENQGKQGTQAGNSIVVGYNAKNLPIHISNK